MTKEAFKNYILEAIEAMDDAELDYLFPASDQPDLFSIASELTGLRGEVKKLAGASLRSHNELHSFLEQQQADASDGPDPEMLTAENLALREELKTLLLQVLEQDDQIGQASRQLEELPAPGLFSLGAFKAHLASWQKGFGITVSKWQVFVKSLGLHKTGLPGEPFNPKSHEAVDVKFDPSLPANAVLETEVTGFLYKQQVLRLARVVVNKYPEPKPEPPQEMAPLLPGPAGTSKTTEPPAPSIAQEGAEPSKKRKEKSKRKTKKKKQKNR